MVKFSVDFEDNAELIEAFKKIPREAERITNDFLSGNASENVIRSIIGLMPVSNRNKSHAAGSNSLKKKLINLGFEIVPQKAYQYLVFPNDGIGRSNPTAHQFFEKGLANEEPNITKQLIDKLTQSLEL